MKPIPKSVPGKSDVFDEHRTQQAKLSRSRLENIILEIKNPEITKNMSTPMNPPGSFPGKAWNATTEIIATARKPSISGDILGV